MAADAPARVTRERLRGIYAILNEAPNLLALASEVLDGGIRLVQYRAKDGVRRESLESLRSLTREFDALLFLNDDWRAAVEYGCDGAHLGPGDDGFDEPERVHAAAPHLLLGCSCATAAEVRRANEGGADYVGIGSVFATQSKSDAGAPIGIAGLQRLARVSRVPVAAIGGIAPDNLSAIRASGVAMAALISAISAAQSPRSVARELVAAWSAN